MNNIVWMGKRRAGEAYEKRVAEDEDAVSVYWREVHSLVGFWFILGTENVKLDEGFSR